MGQIIIIIVSRIIKRQHRFVLMCKDSYHKHRTKTPNLFTDIGRNETKGKNSSESDPLIYD